MYRFMMERAIFNRLQRQAISVSKRYYQCDGVGVYGYRPKKVEPFQRKLVLVFFLLFLFSLKNKSNSTSDDWSQNPLLLLFIHFS